MKNAAKRVFSCKDRCRYSRKRAKFCRKVAKNWQLPTIAQPAEGAAAEGGPPRPVPPEACGEATWRESAPGAADSKISKFAIDKLLFANFWRARSRLYQNEMLQENMRLTAFFKLYKMCTLLHRCDPKFFFAKNRFEKSAIFVKFQQHFCKGCKICKILPNFKIFS